MEEDEYAGRAECEGGWKENDSTKQREGVNGGHRVMRGLNATNAMSQGLIKTSSALLPRSGHAHMHLCHGTGGFECVCVCVWMVKQHAQSILLMHIVWDKRPPKINCAPFLNRD